MPGSPMHAEELEFLAALAHDDEALAAADYAALAGLGPVPRLVADALLAGTNGDWPRVDQASTLLRGHPQAEAILGELASLVPTRPLTELVRWLHDRRRLQALVTAARHVLQLRDDPRSLPEAAAVLASAVAAPDAVDCVVSGIGAVEAYLQAAYSGHAGLIPSGIPLVDRVGGGWRRGSLHLVLGLTGHGKTALLVQTAHQCAAAGFRVYFVSSEMTRVDLVPRLLAGEADRIAAPDGSPLSSAGFSRFDRAAVQAVPGIAQAMSHTLQRILIDDEPEPNMDNVLVRIARRHAAHPVDVVLLDYLQMVRAQGDNREQQVREVAARGKALARQLNCAVIMASQIVDPPPWARDVLEAPRTPATRESRAASHAADLILELARVSEPDGRYVSYKLRLSKVRHGGSEQGDQLARFDRRTCRFGWPEAPSTVGTKVG